MDTTPHSARAETRKMSAEETVEQAERADLSDLVRDRMAELGKGVRTIADATVDPENPDAGPQYKRGTLDNLINNRGVKPPTEAQLRGLQAALDVPLVALQRAASAQFFGYVSERWGGGAKHRLFIARIEEFSERELDKLDQMADIMLRRDGDEAQR
ncbi:transcriptional regulator [Streptomyces alfalfae]|nr:hypothetical protein [Streptomyces alfalfae]AYA18624.1 XRE family transcriptional regulator [Streptomyces fradiae]RXX46496.1 transcriptional regulator [Streptomyces alfalfae]RZM90009.1 XRE family transcriptional regulator [Streptomyces alfalfae]